MESIENEAIVFHVFGSYQLHTTSTSTTNGYECSNQKPMIYSLLQ